MTDLLKWDKARKLAKVFWERACKLDDIPTDATFVIFSKDNPYARLSDRANTLKWTFGKRADMFKGYNNIVKAMRAA
jgi:hypothetical protein